MPFLVDQQNINFCLPNNGVLLSNLVHYVSCFIIAKYANLPIIPPFLQPGIDQYDYGVNFASAGAGALVETFHGDVSIITKKLFCYMPFCIVLFLCYLGNLSTQRMLLFI